MRSVTAPGRLGVYVSVPFCRAKCSFCNFASGVSSPARVEDYLERLCSEIDSVRTTADELGAELPEIVDTIYLGGGTPSLLSPIQLRQIFTALRRNLDIASGAEVTLEAAPGQIADEFLEEALNLGVNRISLGIQSFVDRESAAVGRTHTGQSCLAEIRRLRARGVKEIAGDLIAGLPYQTRESWAKSLDEACSSDLTHLSVYLLEIDEDSRLGREVLGGGALLHAPAVADETLAAELYEEACGFLEANGFRQYEISNFARGSEHESRHNRKYWERLPYVGFGLDAHSMLLRPENGAVRFANPDKLQDYAGASAREITSVGMREAFEESVFLGLRLTDGLDADGLRAQYPNRWVEATEERVRDLARDGLMSVDGDRWRLTTRGRLVSSEVFGELLAVCA